MSRAKLGNFLSHLPAWAALLLGGGALMSSAQADVKQQPQGQPDFATREVAVKTDGENIFISQDGRTFEELRLGDTREALHLRKLLRDEASDGRTITIPVGSMIVASGGATGRGWGWKTAHQPADRPAAKKGDGK